jgi:predicted MFS family arabinose efflux permease
MTDQTATAPVAPHERPTRFSRYQSLLVALLALTQFTIILDFTIIAPLGAILMPSLHITAAQFGVAVSAYAFSAGISGILAAGFADRFDRKRLLIFLYVGFILGTLLCAVAQTYEMLLFGRILTGLFSGVIGSVVLAIIADLFPISMRGRVMGFVQTAFGASQVLGIPAALYLTNLWNWHACFAAIVALSLIVVAAIVVGMRPVTDHLRAERTESPFGHLIATLKQPRYTLPFAITTLLATGGYVLMPFTSTYVVRNLGIPMTQLPTIYLIAGLTAIAAGPIVGRVSDAIGKFPVFLFGTILSSIMVLIYVHLGHVPLITVIIVNVLQFIGLFSFIIPSQALMSAIPDANQRGSFNAVSASLQQLSGGLASVIAAAIIAENADGSLLHFDWLGYLVIASSVVSTFGIYFVQRAVARRANA